MGFLTLIHWGHQEKQGRAPPVAGEKKWEDDEESLAGVTIRGVIGYRQECVTKIVLVFWKT